MKKTILFLCIMCMQAEPIIDNKKRILTLVQDIAEYMENLPDWLFLPFTFLSDISFKQARTDLSENNPYKNTDTNIAQGQCSPQEYAFIQKIQQRIAQKISVQLGQEIPQEKCIRIALCSSGGGYRAMISSLGFLAGLERASILDCITYNCTLSGSAWAQACLITSNTSITQFTKQLKNNVTKNLQINSNKGFIEPIKKMSEIKILLRYLLQKFVFYQRITSVDMWGALIANNILNNLSFVQDKKISSQQLIVQEKNMWLPIYTAISPVNNNYEWYEITPFDVRNLTYNTYVPVWAFGRKYEHGTAKPLPAQQGTLYPEELSLANIIGIIGSAYTVNLKEVITIMQEDNDLTSTESFLLNFLLTIDEKTFNINQFRLLPSLICNMHYLYPTAATSNKKEVVLIDAGIHSNIPLVPLLQPERAVDLIIIFDASATVPDRASLKNMQEYAEIHHLPMSSLPLTELNNKEIIVCKADKPGMASIIYVPYDCTDSFCSTFNFYYDEDNFNTLYTKALCIAEQAVPIIQEQITTIQQHKLNIIN